MVTAINGYCPQLLLGDGSRRLVRTGRHRCTDLALNTLFEFELPTDAMVLNIIDDGIIYRTGTTLWKLPILDDQRVGEAVELCTDPRLEYANWVAAAITDENTGSIENSKVE